ncbi:MAG: STAS domain-containing protein [Planctomycetota bacterium]|nr:STAS domain-containing protein [Planctomycetota bacterium]
MIHLPHSHDDGLEPALQRQKKHRLRFSNLNEAVVIWLPEDLYELLAIVEAGEEMSRFVKHSQPRRLVVSFDHVCSCGSQAVGDLVNLAKQVRKYGGEIKLCSMSNRVREVFDLCRLIGPVFDVYSSAGEAVESFPPLSD